jgi:hypothetical protein
MPTVPYGSIHVSFPSRPSEIIFFKLILLPGVFRF